MPKLLAPPSRMRFKEGFKKALATFELESCLNAFAWIQDRLKSCQGCYRAVSSIFVEPRGVLGTVLTILRQIAYQYHPSAHRELW